MSELDLAKIPGCDINSNQWDVIWVSCMRAASGKIVPVERGI